MLNPYDGEHVYKNLVNIAFIKEKFTKSHCLGILYSQENDSELPIAERLFIFYQDLFRPLS